MMGFGLVISALIHRETRIGLRYPLGD